MEDDLVSSLTHQVKQEVIENYFLERRLIESQVEYLRRKAGKTRARALVAGKRLAWLAFLMLRPEMVSRLKEILQLEDDCFWAGCLEVKTRRKFVQDKVRALTKRAKYRKLVFRAYCGLYDWMKKYREQYDDSCDECSAVNKNIVGFQKNFDLLAILNFFKNLDTQGIEKRKILGDNFNAREMAELDKNLYIRPVACEQLAMPVPMDFPEPRQVGGKFSDLADEIYRKYGDEVRKLLG